VNAGETYDAASDHYDDPALSFWDRTGERTVERLSLRPGARVLDVCCGAGASALAAARRVGPEGRVLGIDLAGRLLDRARAKAAAAGLAHAEFRRGDLMALDGAGGPFDAVVCVFGIFFVEDMAEGLRRLHAQVAAGGTLAVTTWGPGVFEPANTYFWNAVRREDASLYKAYNPWDRISQPGPLLDLFAEAGITGAAVEPEAVNHPLHAPEEFWSIVLGTGYRATIERLSPASRDRVRTACIGGLREREVRSIAVNVIHATVRKAEA